MKYKYVVEIHEGSAYVIGVIDNRILIPLDSDSIQEALSWGFKIYPSQCGE